MPHCINVFLGGKNKINSLANTLGGEQAQLSQGLSILFPTNEFFGRGHLDEDEKCYEIFLTYEYAAMCIIDVLRTHSKNEKLAYSTSTNHWRVRRNA